MESKSPQLVMTPGGTIELDYFKPELFMPNFPSQGAALTTDEEGGSTAGGAMSTARKHKKS